MAHESKRQSERLVRDESAVLPDEVDAALEALWRGDSGKLDQLIGSTLSGEHDESTIARMVRAAAQLHSSVEPIVPPREIDDFAIEGEIGRGGMGVVYRARQKHPDRTVAIKLIQPGRFSEEHARRFRYEADVLASLNHPNIAAIHQAGINEIDGQSQPYIVMELIDGMPITKYATAHHCSVRDRIALFLCVCDAVQYAHQRGVMHRDLKPDNVLVADSPDQASPTVKLVDFGVARPLNEEKALAQPRTTEGSFVGTVLYMSPEQVTGETIDARSDVYSLGVMLYELLLGHLPYETKGQAPTAIMDAIANQSPQFDADSSIETDLQIIIRTAMAKALSERYASVDAFAKDLRSFLRHEPIAARPPSVAYQLARFTRRNPTIVAGAAVLTVVVAVAFITITSLLIEASTARAAEAEQRHIAEREVEKQQAVRRFLEDMLSAADPRIAASGNPDVTVREIVDHAAAALDAGDVRYEPEVEALVRDLIADVYVGFAMYDDAMPLFRSAAALRDAHLPPDHPDHGLTLHNLGSLHYRLGELEPAEEMLTQALQWRVRHAGELSDAYATTLNNLAMVVSARGDYAKAYEMQQRVIAVRRVALSEDHPLFAQALNNTGMSAFLMGQYDEAELLFRRALTKREEIFGQSHPEVAETLSNLAAVMQEQGDFSETESLLRRSISILREAYGSDHPELRFALSNLGVLMFHRERYDEAATLMQESVDVAERAYGSTHAAVVVSKNNLAVILSRLEQWDEAEAIMREVLDARLAMFSEMHPEVAASYNTLGQLLKRTGRPDQAEGYLQRALEIRVDALGGVHPDTLGSAVTLAALYSSQDRLAEAEAVLMAAYQWAETESLVEAAASQAVLDALVALYEQMEDQGTAERFRAMQRSEE